MQYARSIAKGKVLGRCLTANGDVVVKSFPVSSFPDGRILANLAGTIFDPTNIGAFNEARQQDRIYTIVNGLLTAAVPTNVFANSTVGVGPPSIVWDFEATRIFILASPGGTDCVVDIDYSLAFASEEDLLSKTFTEPDPCFLAGTLVGTPERLIPIEELKIGQQIYSFDINNDEIVRSEVAKIMKRTSDCYYEVVIAGETILVTGEHPFYVPKMELFVPVNQLHVGYEIQQLDGPDLAITHIEINLKATPVFNLTVDNMHNYFVGNRGLLVHNK